MKAILLAAGASTRLLPFTAHKSKALVEVGGVSLIDRIVISLKENGINHITVVTGYYASQLEKHLLNKHKDVRFRFIFNEEYLNKNNIVALYLGFKNTVLDDDILLVEADLIFEKKIIKNLVNNPIHNVAVIAKYLNWMDGSVVSIKNGVVNKFFLKKEQIVNFSYKHKYKTVNIYKLSKEICKNLLLPYLETGIKKDSKSYYESSFKNLVELNELEFSTYILDKEKWYEIDDPIDLKVAEYIFNSEKDYEQLAAAFGGYWLYDVMDFSLLTNSYFPTEYMLNQLRNDLEILLKNYSSSQSILDDKLSYVLGVSKSKVIFLNRTELNISINKTLEAKRILVDNLKNISEISTIYKTSTNFVVIKIKKSSIDKNVLLHDLLVNHRILIKDVTSKFEDGNDYFRIAVRTIEDNNYFIKCFKKVLKNAKRR